MKETLFDIAVADLPPPFVQGILRGLEWVYNEARERAENDPGLDRPEARYLRPHLRYALCNMLLRREAKIANLESSVEPNAANNHEYTLVKAGRLAITASYVDIGKNMPRPSKFRSQHSEINQHIRQGSLFDGKSSQIKNAGIYGILLHGPYRGDESSPGFLRLGFPDAACEQWVDDPIDVYDIMEAQVRLYRRPDEDLQGLIQDAVPSWKKRIDTIDTEKEA